MQHKVIIAMLIQARRKLHTITTGTQNEDIVYKCCLVVELFINII